VLCQETNYNEEKIVITFIHSPVGLVQVQSLLILAMLACQCNQLSSLVSASYKVSDLRGVTFGLLHATGETDSYIKLLFVQ
jgi:hypothetical protein